MDQKTLVKSAVTLAASLAVQHQAFAAQENVQCVPIAHNTEIQILELCDASEINKQLSLKLNSYGCAIEQEYSKDDDWGWVNPQALYYDYSEYEDEPKPTVKLPKCTFEQVVNQEMEL